VKNVIFQPRRPVKTKAVLAGLPLSSRNALSFFARYPPPARNGQGVKVKKWQYHNNRQFSREQETGYRRQGTVPDTCNLCLLHD